MRTMIAFLTASVLSACTSWHTEPLSPQQLIDVKHPDRVRVTLHDSTRIVVHAPRIVSDSLLGLSDNRPMTMPLGNVTRIDTRHFSAGKTIGLALAIPGGIFVALVVYCAAANGKCEFNSN